MISGHGWWVQRLRSSEVKSVCALWITSCEWINTLIMMITLLITAHTERGAPGIIVIFTNIIAMRMGMSVRMWIMSISLHSQQPGPCCLTLSLSLDHTRPILTEDSCSFWDRRTNRIWANFITSSEIYSRENLAKIILLGYKSACDEWCLPWGTNFPLSLSPKHWDFDKKNRPQTEQNVTNISSKTPPFQDDVYLPVRAKYFRRDSFVLIVLTEWIINIRMSKGVLNDRH